MTSDKNLIALQFPFFDDKYEDNLQKLITHIKKAPKGSVVLAPELCLTNFSFQKMQESALFGESALPKLLKLCDDKIVAFTMTEKIDGNFYNCAKIIHNGVVVHTQPKVNLFKFGDEDKYFKEGKVENIKIIEIDGLKYAILICFEIRFIEFWEKIKGADIILVLALWGKLRKEQFEAITKSLAIMNQAFVIASGSSNENMASSSAIITPFGKEFRDEKSEFITKVVDLKEIKKMRRYMDVGIL